MPAMLRDRRWTLTAALPLAALLAGCPSPSGPADPPGSTAYDSYSSGSGESATTSEAARTREMEERAREMERMAREGQDPNATEQEKQRAYEEFERERQKLNAEGEGRETAAGDEGGDGGE